MTKKCLAAAFALAATCAAFACGAVTGFDANYDAAAARAKANGRPVFALFTGSDWCIWCKRLEQEVLSQPAFLDVATNAYELAVLDFPSDNSRQTDAERRRNKALSEKFGVQGYPTVLLIDAESGAELYRAGYERGGAKAWIESFQKGAKIKPLLNRHLKPFEDELREEFMAMAKEHKATAATDGKSMDYAKMAAEAKTSAQKHLPALQSIRERLAAAKVPAELDEEKVKILTMVEKVCEQCESLAKRDVTTRGAVPEGAPREGGARRRMAQGLEREHPHEQVDRDMCFVPGNASAPIRSCRDGSGRKGDGR